jgi:hypothetical protein
MGHLNDDELRALASEFAASLSRYAPGWTDKQNADPGITLVELFAFLAENLLARGKAIPEREYATLARVLDQLASLRCPACTSTNGLTRPRYFSGQLLSAADFQAEQDYMRTKMRRENRCLVGAGVVSGLGVALDPASAANDDPTITVEPGCAIASDGEQLTLCAPLRCTLRTQLSAGYVTLRYFERAVSPSPVPSESPEPSRIAEGVAVDFQSEASGQGVAIARLERAAGVWRLDSRFQPARIK